MAMHEPPEGFWSGLRDIINAGHRVSEAFSALSMAMHSFMENLPPDQLADYVAGMPLTHKYELLIHYEQKQLFSHCAALRNLICTDLASVDSPMLNEDERAAFEKLEEKLKQEQG